MPRTKTGEQITWKEYFARWKKGIQTLSQLQQIKGQINSTWIIIIGVVAGFIITLFDITKLWWLTLILGGAFGNTSIQQLALYQKKVFLQKIDDALKVSLDEPVINYQKEVKQNGIPNL